MGLRGRVGLRTEELAVTTSNRKRHADRKRFDRVLLSRRFEKKNLKKSPVPGNRRRGNAPGDAGL